MDYAIILCFDNATETKFIEIINAIAHSGVNNYILDSKIPPHITISYFTAERINDIVYVLDSHYSDFITKDHNTPGDIIWASLGAFVPEVLFAAPVLNEYLTNACAMANKLVEPLSDIGDGGHYLPNRWVPHTTLAVSLTQDDLKTAFDKALELFSALSGRVNRLILAECDPYKEVKVWSLV